MSITTPTKAQQTDAPIPPLENGDRLTRDEFERRYEAMPELKKAELINGRVYMASEFSHTADKSVPPLENGDRLTRAEFERRYANMPHLHKAELIKGVVYMASPLKFRKHGKQTSRFHGWLTFYVAATPGVDTGDNCTVKLIDGDEPQPDALLMILPEFGGQCRIDADDYLVGGPDWILEVSASSASYDLHEKLEVYRQNGVREYVVWRVLDQAIDWFVLVGDQYDRLPPSPEGWYKSRVFPGLWLDPQAMLADDLAKVFQVVQQGVASAEHQQFVAELARRQTPSS